MFWDIVCGTVYICACVVVFCLMARDIKHSEDIRTLPHRPEEWED